VKLSIPVSARSEAWVCRRSLVGISGSNPSSSSRGVLLSVVCLTARDGEASMMMMMMRPLPIRGCCTIGVGGGGGNTRG